MNQKLEHGMKVRAKQYIHSVADGSRLWRSGVEYKVTCNTPGETFVGSWVAHKTTTYYDYTDLFDIIPNPMTAEEAMEKILEWRKKLTLIDAGLYDIIDEYKKGLGND